jgi:SPP1 gp7 family putative phage head morphogenesis protein
VIALTPAARTRAWMQARRAFMARRPRRRPMPRQRHPRRVVEFYYAALHRVLERARAAVAPIVQRALAGLRLDSINDDVDVAAEVFFRQVLDPHQLEGLLGDVAARTDEVQKAQLGAQLAAGLGVNPLASEVGLEKRAAEFTSENVALIKSLPARYFDEVEKILTRGIADGARAEQIAEELSNRFAISDRQAALIARDQVGKYFGALNATRQQALGISGFFWRTSNDDRVRDEHQLLEGERFSWDAPPSEGIPGQAINCRCTADPDLSDLLAE